MRVEQLAFVLESRIVDQCSYMRTVFVDHRDRTTTTDGAEIDLATVEIRIAAELG